MIPAFFGADHVRADHVIDLLIDRSAGHLFVVYAGFMVAAGALIVCGFLPSIIAEVFPARSTTTTQSEALGNWLDGGYAAVRTGAVLAMFGFFVVFPLSALASHLFCGSACPGGWLGKLCATSFIRIVGVAVGGGAISFVVATRGLVSSASSFLGRLRVLLDTLIDVDNWLRERPADANPRLKIFARYVSLLRHVHAQGYDSLVVVSHSQGTVVTADVFRYLTLALGGSHLAKFGSVRLLTVGTPLRQLYAWRFLELYRWVHRQPFGDYPPGPSARCAGVAQWVNMYGSGDYVGRYLWSSDIDAGRWKEDAIIAGAPPLTAEYCVGAAAHTHYLDPGNADVCRQLDGLIQQ